MNKEKQPNRTTVKVGLIGLLLVTQIFAKQGYQKFVREDALSCKVPTRNDKTYNASQNIVRDGVPDVPRKLE